MQGEAAFRKRMGKLFEAQSLAVLSTCRQGRAYGTLIGFAATADFGRIVFATLRHTRKYANIRDNEHVSILIDSRTNQVDDFRDAVAVTAIGTAREVTGQERKALAELYLKRHFYLKDFIGDPNCAVIAVEVHRYILVSQFQQVFEMEMQP
jgi:nitroimidazol reductase NimA-like FMN-containing flavoprotein (pyridoxamine 5'-phosphate oxidase superfamily)